VIKQINKCRICNNNILVEVLDLGEQYLTSIFPKKSEIQQIRTFPLKLVKCHGDSNVCNLIQLQHSVEKKLMYSNDYGYRSGLNQSMVDHLQKRILKIKKIVQFNNNDIVVDIGSNDGTTLSNYDKNVIKIGIDPTAEKFRNFYKDDIVIVNDFFSKQVLKNCIGNKKIKVITSFAMFYDLDNPLDFAEQIKEVLDPVHGIWVLEQSYLPEMISKLSFDTVCHEHLEYYSLFQINWIMKNVGLKIIDVDFNEVNGGSFAVTVCNIDSNHYSTPNYVKNILKFEKENGFLGKKVFKEFSNKVKKFRDDFHNFLLNQRNKGKKIMGIGASTKGNVILQYCNIDSNIVPFIGEINPEKFNKFTPGSWIEIVDEINVLKQNPDLLMILPWHFKEFFIKNSKYRKFDLLFPLPKQQIVKSK
tara:strand:+ start:85 stop:1332 length:1248 start_codon:yes stop_codon:yes gene_type:complete